MLQFTKLQLLRPILIQQMKTVTNLDFSANIKWRRGVAVERRTRDREVVGSSLDRALRRKNSGQVSHT